MMLYSVITWSLTAILGIWSLVLLSGHGAISIAGYNTMTEDEKKKIIQSIIEGYLKEAGD